MPQGFGAPKGATLLLVCPVQQVFMCDTSITCLTRSRTCRISGACREHTSIYALHIHARTRAHTRARTHTHEHTSTRKRTHAHIGAETRKQNTAGFSCPGAPNNGMNECAASPGAYCPAGDTDDEPDPCLQGSYCDGGSAQPKPCTAAAGYYCPPGSSEAKLCPAVCLLPVPSLRPYPFALS